MFYNSPLKYEGNTTAQKVHIFGIFPVHIFSHLDWIRENMDQKNSEYAHFSGSGYEKKGSYSLYCFSK